MKSKWRKQLNPETRAVLAWMMDNDVLSSEIARAKKITHSAVSHFLAGRIASAGLRSHFIDIGCPELLMKGIDRLREQTKKDQIRSSL